jgi:aspartyl-tRNA(Asn)/glutamyl-tRNA(Gln) amidotransferase subunit A
MAKTLLRVDLNCRTGIPAVPSLMDFRTESAVGLAGQVRRGELSARELVSHALERIEALNPTVNAFVAVDGERALAAAAKVDDKVAAGKDPGPLAGLPLAVKDLEDAAGYVTTLGSAALSDRAPATADSMMVERLVAAGCVVVGKTNTPELGWKADTVNAAFGRTLNPWNLDHTPGGSSGGTAAAIASGMVPLGTGSDGGGSIRIPSACCGLSGMKASLGRVPTGGRHAPDWHNLSTRGPMARQLADVIAALDVVVGPDATDLRSLPRPEASWLAVLNDPKPPQRVAWSPTLGYADVDAEVLAICEQAVEVLASLGADIVEVESVFDEDPVTDWLTLTSAYNRRTHAELEGTPDWDQIDPVLVRIIEAAASTTAMDMIRAEDSTYTMNARLVDLFHDVRLLVTPTTAAAAPPHGLDGSALINGTPDFNWVKFTYPFNMTRSPAATVCAGLTTARIPVGVQLIGPQHGDLVVLRSAAALEEALGFDALAPEISGLR